MKKRGSQLGSSSSTERPASEAGRLSRSDGSEHPSVRAGRLGRPHGLNGFLGLYVDPEDLVHFETGSTVYIKDTPYIVRTIRRADKGHQVVFENVASREEADAIRNEDVFVFDRRTLKEHEFWPDDLVGLEVRPGGGKVVAVNHGPAQDRLVIERDGVRFEVPFVDALVPVVDVDGGFVETAEIEGLTEPSS